MNIFLTGASSGIGQALAKEFAANGATLGLVARREDKLKELIAELPNPELHTAIVCDVTDRDRLIEEAVSSMRPAAESILRLPVPVFPSV